MILSEDCRKPLSGIKRIYKEEVVVEKYRQYQGIDVLKFIMAILVISLHIYPFTDINETLNYYTINWFSRLAVPFFFVCTGFFIFSGTIGEINRKLTGGGIL